MAYFSTTIRNRVHRNKVVSLSLTAMMICWPALALTGCSGGGLFGLEDYQRDLLFGVGSLATGLLNEGQVGPQGLTGPAGPPGEPSEANPIPGADGLSCWDLNQNGQPDPEEDINEDGVVDTLDCRGADGEDGEDGPAGIDAEDGAEGTTGPSGSSGQSGPPGSTGQAGEAGADGKSCWDLNENGSGDITEGEDNEDINHDGFVNVLDCRGADGADGLNGVDGTSGSDGSDGSAGANGTNGTNGVDGIDGDNCWDLNGNGVGDITDGEDNEDTNGDQVVNLLDCRGADGVNGRDGIDGLNGTNGSGGTNGINGADGIDGDHCWDLNGNGVGDITDGEDNEDLNHDGFVNVLDCIGADGAAGTNGTNGIDGAVGLDGDNCWDLNGNGVGDITDGEDNEDRNGDQVVNVLDCSGRDGIDGINGLNGADGLAGADGVNGLDGIDGMNCWDLNGNGSRDITNGEDNEDVNGDLVVDILDCRGADGRDGRDGANGISGTNGINGVDGTNGLDGTDGLNGTNGVDGTDGVDGLDGANGIHCWDLNGNGLGDITDGADNEDINNDQVVDVQDCRGAAGQDGIDGQDGVDGRDGVDGMAGRDGVDGQDGAPGPLLFDTYIDEFVTVAGGSYGSIPLNVDGLPIVDIEEPAIGACGGHGVDVVAYRVAVPVRYTPGNPITMRMFIWRTGPRNENCFAMRLDAFRASHGSGIGQYGFARFVTLDDPADPDPMGTLLVVDLPLNNITGDFADGLGFPNDLTPGTLLAFELNAIPGFDDGGCYSMAGVEFYESTVDEPVVVTHASVSATPPAGGCGSFVDCNENGIPDDSELGIEGHINPVGVMICHIPPGNPDLAHTITVSEFAVDAHLAHGDRLGSCANDCNENGIPDECEIDANSLAEGGPYFCSDECVGCPEVCDADENDNGVPDACDENGELADDDHDDDKDHDDDHHGDSENDS